jgi:hypothetical protein
LAAVASCAGQKAAGADSVDVKPPAAPQSPQKSSVPRKVSESLAALTKAWRRCGRRCLNAEAKKYDAEVRQDRIRVRVTAASEADVPAVQKRLKRLGGIEITAFRQTVFVLLPARRIDQAARSRSIERITVSAGNSEPVEVGKLRP